MIKEQDLLDAIAECQGERSPNANTCIKLAAYYTILNNIQKEQMPEYSFASEPETTYDSGTEFSDSIRGKGLDDVLRVVDELMETLQVIIPKLYRVTIDKLRNGI